MLGKKYSLGIYLVTYNRKKHLNNILDFIIALNSPIRDYDITILNNASTDGSTELINEYCKKYSNIKHICRKINIGGDANICQAYEMASTSNYEYIWVLCDDDKYDFSNWNEVEKEFDNKTDIICVADYAIPNQTMKTLIPYQLLQLTFVPAGIYRRELLTSAVIMNMYNTIFTVLSQSCISINAVNKCKTIKVLKHPIVENGLHYEDKVKDTSYFRGFKKQLINERRKNTNWILGYCNIVSMLKSRNLAQSCVLTAIQNKEIYPSMTIFYEDIVNRYFNIRKIHYYLEIAEYLPFSVKLGFINFVFRIYFKILLQKIFSIKNHRDNKYKVITILGIKKSIRKSKIKLFKRKIKYYSKKMLRLV